MYIFITLSCTGRYRLGRPHSPAPAAVHSCISVRLRSHTNSGCACACAQGWQAQRSGRSAPPRSSRKLQAQAQGERGAKAEAMGAARTSSRRYCESRHLKGREGRSLRAGHSRQAHGSAGLGSRQPGGSLAGRTCEQPIPPRATCSRRHDDIRQPGAPQTPASAALRLPAHHEQ